MHFAMTRTCTWKLGAQWFVKKVVQVKCFLWACVRWSSISGEEECFNNKHDWHWQPGNSGKKPREKMSYLTHIGTRWFIVQIYQPKITGQSSIMLFSLHIKMSTNWICHFPIHLSKYWIHIVTGDVTAVKIHFGWMHTWGLKSGMLLCGKGLIPFAKICLCSRQFVENWFMAQMHACQCMCLLVCLQVKIADNCIWIFFWWEKSSFTWWLVYRIYFRLVHLLLFTKV